jgi:hypothetical protein
MPAFLAAETPALLWLMSRMRESPIRSTLPGPSSVEPSFTTTISKSWQV